MSSQSASRVATFRWLCQALSPLVGAAPLRARMPGKEADWNYLVEAASTHLVLPSLYCALRDKGLLADMPAAFGEALQGFHELNVLHNADLRQQMLDTTSLLNGIGVAPVWLKGATGLLSPDWPNSGRMMLDLDFWVPDAGSHGAVLDCLERAGYFIPEAYIGVNDEASHHFIPRFRNGEPARLEIHKHIISRRTSSLLEDQDASGRVQWFSWEGRQIGRLAEADGLMQSYVQCAEMNGGSLVQGQLRLMKVVDFVGRVLALGGSVPAEILAKVDKQPWQSNARRFFSFLERDFGLPSALQYDGHYLRRMKLAMGYPRAAYGLYMVQHAYESIRSGRIGSPRYWWRKLSTHLERMRKHPLDR